MSKLIFIISIFVISCSLENKEEFVNNSVNSSEVLVEELDSEEEVYVEKDQCVPSIDSMLILPFENEIDLIQVVSYLGMRPSHTEDTPQGQTYEIEKDGKIGFNEFKEVIHLDSIQVSKLYGIINDNSSEGYLMGSECYEPHHCIHFLDKKSNLLGYIEICFRCSSTRESTHELNITCRDQLDSFRILFSEIGIRTHLLH